MLALILAGTAFAVHVNVAAVDLVPGQPIVADQLYDVDMPEDLVADAVSNVEISELVGRVPRQLVPKGSLVREQHLFEAGTAAGPEAFVPDGHQLVRVELPSGADFPLPTDRVDVWVKGPEGYCIAAEASIVAAVDGPDGAKMVKLGNGGMSAAWVVIPDAAVERVRNAAKRPVLALRNAIEVEKSGRLLCGSKPKETP